MEAWADPGQLDDDELHEMYVMNSKLFTVHPRGGKVQPGHSQTIVFEYRYCVSLSCFLLKSYLEIKVSKIYLVLLWVLLHLKKKAFRKYV